jgi:uncharacterized membrane protein YgcG
MIKINGEEYNNLKVLKANTQVVDETKVLHSSQRVQLEVKCKV